MIKTELLGKTNEIYVKTSDGSLIPADGTYVTGKFAGAPTFRDEGVYLTGIKYEFDESIMLSADDGDRDETESSLCLINVTASCSVSKA